MANYNSQNLISISVQDVPAGTLAIKIGPDVFIAATVVTAACPTKQLEVDQLNTSIQNFEQAIVNLFGLPENSDSSSSASE